MIEKAREETEKTGEAGVFCQQTDVSAMADYLNSYRLCKQMLGLVRYERRRTRLEQPMGEECHQQILSGNEFFWRGRMFEVSHLIGSMKNGREKLILYYHYIKGESIEHAADLIGFSRRTGYRLHHRGLRTLMAMWEREKQKREKTENQENGS